ncbi:lysophospholipid acyltransferase family protein [Aquimarina sp. 2201CG5-10]|uniref:lysophospholipid acyltransferase family protein n=1 Tax=Aquimarina callyspongiae TaxID=3098150 RepID=UPI002AB374AC|nr:lysophospholipid acyltransferase family protein [Aquimarina sp. 2201CG5-10]MDY8138941.1 lysophospholipid acyltransferase family protein [Aquimarina sp. 2201CG5-10]
MQLLIYRLVYPILWGISKLPWRIFYLFSSGIYLFVYHIVGYRKRIVTENLILVFPEKSKSEISRIRKVFYQHMCDMFLEMIKTMSISEKELSKRFKILNPEILKSLEVKKKSVIVLIAHYASYEWSIAVQFLGSYPIVGVYKKIANKHFDQLIHRIRRRFDARLISKHNTIREITRDKIQGKLCAYGLVTDQSPRLKGASYWTDFMGIKVPAYPGGEKIAKRLDMPVVYLKVEKVKRGHYEAEFIPITETPKDCDDYYITKKYLRLLEKQIYNKPEYYLWTHKRWKLRDAKIPKTAIVD